MKIFFIIILILLFDLYAFQAFVTIAEGWTRAAKWTLYVLYWLVPLLATGLLLGFGVTDAGSWNKNISTVFKALLFIAYLSKFFIIAVLLVDDLIRLWVEVQGSIAGGIKGSNGRSLFLSQLALLLGGLPFVTLTYGILRNPYRYKIFRENITLDDLPDTLDGLRIVQISDIHSGSFTMKEPVKAAVEMINRQKADLVFFTGDLVNSVASEIEPYLDVFDKIKSRYGVFSVLGNHDYGDYTHWSSLEQKQQNFERLKEMHRIMGWDLLLNENRIQEINGERVAVIGVENYSAHARFPKYGDLKKAAEGTDPAAVKFLLSHDPTHWDDEVTREFQDIAITFSGHTHGAQFGIEIPGWIKWSPVKYIYKQWAGLYRQGRQYLYVNRGLGFIGYPGRVGILPEITVIDLKSNRIS